MPVLECTYKTLALEDPEGKWELHDGHLRSKPDMSAEHNDIATQLSHQLLNQLDKTEFQVRVNMSRVRIVDVGSYFIPDVMVVPTFAFRAQTGEPGGLEFYDIPLPLIIEFWSPSTGDYDVEQKMTRNQQRQDLEIWRIHPYGKTLVRQILQPSGEYTQVEHAGKYVQPVALPGVQIDFDAIFDY